MLFKRLIINGTEYPLAVNQTGSGTPGAATEGSAGVLYMDTDTGALYKCLGLSGEEYLWEPLGRSSLAGKACVCFGDSVTGEGEPPEDYPSVLAERTGMTVVNAAISLSGVAANSTTAVDAFCMYRLSDAIATGDWTLQEDNVFWLGEKDQAHFDSLKAVDWSAVDFVTICHGIRDHENAVSLYEFRTALSYAVEKILTAYPHIRILLLTPTYRFWPGESGDSDTKSVNSVLLTAFVTEVKDAGVNHKLPVLDLYHTSGLNSYTKSHYFQEDDGIVPNAAGQRRIGEKIAAKMMAEFC